MSEKIKIGVLGGGQLGMMLYEASAEFSDLELEFLDPNRACSVAHVGGKLQVGSFRDEQTVLAFGANKDVITVEIEDVSTSALKQLRDMGKKVYPQPEILEMIQDKGLQKQFYLDARIPTAPFSLLETGRSIFADDLPCVLKSRRGGYDGKGVIILKEESDLEKAFDRPSLKEEIAHIEKELSVIVSRNERGEVKSFPIVEMVFDPIANLVDTLVSPADVDLKIANEAQAMAQLVIEKMGLVGILAVELFLNRDGSIWVNEVAPRPHNSGHQTIEGNNTSQYAQHLRAISGMDLGDPSSKGTSVMINVVGGAEDSGSARINPEPFVGRTDAFLHDYHKSALRPFRKMGHFTVVNKDRNTAIERAKELKTQVGFEMITEG